MNRILHRTLSNRADLAIDLGTANTIVVERGSGVVFDEPSVCCFSGHGAASELVAAGTEARRLVGRIAEPLRTVRPLRHGVVSDMKAARELLRIAAAPARSRWGLRRARVVIGVPADTTEAERRALITAASDAGLPAPELVAEPFLSAIGAGLDVRETRGRMVVDCGAGTTEVAVISIGAICFAHSVRGGGDALDRALIEHLHSRRGFKVGASTAERLKLELSASLDSGDKDRLIEVRGLELATGAPRTIAVPAGELMTVWDRYSDPVLSAVLAALAKTSPELSEDILEDGILLTGGAAMTGLLADRISRSTGIVARVSEAPLQSVAAGLAQLLETRS